MSSLGNVMPNGDPWEGFFYPSFMLIIDSYNAIMRNCVTLCHLFIITGVTLNITAEVGMLKIATAVPTLYKGMTFGLLGNYNDNPDDDFVPRGETVPLPSNHTERQIFDFGSTCKISK